MTTASFPRTVALFGGSGFVGRHIVHALAPLGWRLKIASRHPHLAGHLYPSGFPGQIACLKANVLDPKAVARVLEGCDGAVYLPGVPFERGLQTFENIHCQGLSCVAQTCRTMGITDFIHLSALLGDKNSPSRYAITKRKGEEIIQTHLPDAHILRPSVIFGPDDQFFNMLASLARWSPILPLIGGGHTLFQPVFVGDIGDMVAALLQGRGGRGKIWELGGPQILSFRQICELVLTITDRRRLLLPIPWSIAKLQAAILNLFPKPLLTPDQVTLLQENCIISQGATDEGRIFEGVGIVPRALTAIVPTYLARYRKEGQFTKPSSAA